MLLMDTTLLPFEMWGRTYLLCTIPQPHKSQETQLVTGLGVSGEGRDEWVECVGGKGAYKVGKA